MWHMCVHVHGLSASCTVDCSELCVVLLKLSWTCTHTSLPTPVLTNVCIVTPDTVGRMMCVTVGGTTWEHGDGAATLPNVPALGEGVCQNVLKELRGCCVHSAHALPLPLLKC